MTREEILNMSAGREVDALIAEKLMEVSSVRLFREVWTGCIDGQRNVIDHYSTRISDAFSIFGQQPNYRMVNVGYSDYSWYCEIQSHDLGKPLIKASADTAPLAICRAALLAVMSEE